MKNVDVDTLMMSGGCLAMSMGNQKDEYVPQACDGPRSSVASTKLEAAPKRPTPAYIVFYQMERKRILDEHDKGLNDTTPLSDRRYNYTYEDVCAFVRQKDGEGESTLKSDLLEMGKPQRRRHVKSHGKIGFKELSKLVAARWKQLPDSERCCFNKSYSEEMAQYRIKLSKWEQQKKNLMPSCLTPTNERSPFVDCKEDGDAVQTAATSTDEDCVVLSTKNLKGSVRSIERIFGVMPNSCPNDPNMSLRLNDSQGEQHEEYRSFQIDEIPSQPAFQDMSLKDVDFFVQGNVSWMKSSRNGMVEQFVEGCNPAESHCRLKRRRDLDFATVMAEKDHSVYYSPRSLEYRKHNAVAEHHIRWDKNDASNNNYLETGFSFNANGLKVDAGYRQPLADMVSSTNFPEHNVYACTDQRLPRRSSYNGTGTSLPTTSEIHPRDRIHRHSLGSDALMSCNMPWITPEQRKQQLRMVVLQKMQLLQRLDEYEMEQQRKVKKNRPCDMVSEENLRTPEKINAYINHGIDDDDDVQDTHYHEVGINEMTTDMLQEPGGCELDEIDLQSLASIDSF